MGLLGEEKPHWQFNCSENTVSTLFSLISFNVTGRKKRQAFLCLAGCLEWMRYLTLLMAES